MAFVMRDEWKEEPVSTTGAEYVEPSATELIKPGQRVSHLFPRSVMEEFVLQRVTERVWWVTRQFYGSLFYVGERGVLLFDPFLGGADATLAAIASQNTAIWMSRFGSDLPRPADVLEWPSGTGRNRWCCWRPTWSSSGRLSSTGSAADTATSARSPTPTST